MEVLAKWDLSSVVSMDDKTKVNEHLAYQTTNHGTQVEDHPEPGDVATFQILGRVGHHDGALCSP